MNKEEFIGKLQMCYFGERNAFDEIVSEFDRLNNIINELEKYINKWMIYYSDGMPFAICKEFLDKLKELKENK